MAEYDLVYMQEHCIDVYFKYSHKPFHVLTFGTVIPSPLNNVDKNRLLQHQVAVEMEELRRGNTVVIEQGYVTTVLEDTLVIVREQGLNEKFLTDEDTILQMFKPAAELGFYSYDCIEELEDGRGLYQLVAYPGEEIEVSDYDNLPELNEIEIVEEDRQRGLVRLFRM